MPEELCVRVGVNMVVVRVVVTGSSRWRRPVKNHLAVAQHHGTVNDSGEIPQLMENHQNGGSTQTHPAKSQGQRLL